MRTHCEIFRRRGEVIYRVHRPHVDGPYTDYLVTKGTSGQYSIKGGIPLPAEFVSQADELFAQAKIWNAQREQDK